MLTLLVADKSSYQIAIDILKLKFSIFARPCFIHYLSMSCCSWHYYYFFNLSIIWVFSLFLFILISFWSYHPRYQLFPYFSNLFPCLVTLKSDLKVISFKYRKWPLSSIISRWHHRKHYAHLNVGYTVIILKEYYKILNISNHLFCWKLLISFLFDSFFSTRCVFFGCRDFFLRCKIGSSFIK